MRPAFPLPALVVVIGSLLLGACGPQDESAPQFISDGERTLPKNTLGWTYKAPGSRTCRWWITLKESGAVVNSGTRNPNIKPEQRMRTHTFTVNSSLAGKAVLHSDNCGPWRR